MKVRNNNQSNIYFKQLPFKKVNGVKLFEEFHCRPKTPKGNDYFVRVTNEECFQTELSIKVDNIDCRTIGASEFTIENGDTLYTENMETFGRNKNHGVGSVMHLSMIATMLENGLKKVKLFSLGQAVHFHSKFKFEPKINSITELKSAIERNILIHDGDGMVYNAVLEAKDWLTKNYSSNRKRIAEGNRILYEYLQEINRSKLNEMNEFEVTSGFEMELSKDKIVENREFFNNLFKKFGIDYET